MHAEEDQIYESAGWRKHREWVHEENRSNVFGCVTCHTIIIIAEEWFFNVNNF